MMQDRVKVWDLPVRIFHWALVVAILTCLISISQGELEIHLISGVSVLGLVVFRIIWGFIGSSHARFSDFIRGPSTIIRYMKTSLSPTEGHNPMGAYMVLFMLVFLLWQGASGLFTNSDEWFFGPLASMVSDRASSQITKLHRMGEYVIYAMIALHLLAIIAYRVIKKKNLVKAMITGHRSKAEAHEGNPTLKYDRPILGFVLMIILGFMMYAWLIAGWF